MATPVTSEKVVYLLDPGPAAAPASGRRSAWAPHAVELPYIPPFLRKHDGIVMSLGQFLQYTGGQIMATGAVQIWPGMPVEEALVENGRVCGVRLRQGGPVRRSCRGWTSAPPLPWSAMARSAPSAANSRTGSPRHKEWAVGMKMVVDLPESATLEPGTVLHTFGYPEPEIFGFLYVHPGNVASVGIFVPSWMQAPAHSAYEYLQYFMLHPYLWRHLQGGKLRSWGAKSLNESGRRGRAAARRRRLRADRRRLRLHQRAHRQRRR